jgi:ribulose kinase
MFGLTLAHGPAELYRSCVEAIAYGTRNVVQSFEDAGVPVDTLTVGGGIRHNPLWVQITADVLGRSFELVRTDNLATRGAAICGAVAAGRYGSLREAAVAMAVDVETVEPEPSHIDRYESGFALYGDAIRDATDTLHRLAGS